MDAWAERLRPQLWWQALADSGIDVETAVHARYPLDVPLPWDHIHIRQGRAYLEREQERSRGIEDVGRRIYGYILQSYILHPKSHRPAVTSVLCEPFFSGVPIIHSRIGAAT